MKVVQELVIESHDDHIDALWRRCYCLEEVSKNNILKPQQKKKQFNLLGELLSDGSSYAGASSSDNCPLGVVLFLIDDDES